MAGGLPALVGLAVLAAPSTAANWVQPVNAPLNASPAGNAQVPRIAAIGGVPWVAWQESNGATTAVHVAKLGPSSWLPVGSPLTSDSAHYFRYPDIAGVNNLPFLAWMQSVSGHDEVVASRLSGGSWSAAGGSLNVDPTHYAEGPTIAGRGSTPYIAWDEYNGVSAELIHVAQFNGTSWTPVGGVLNANPSESGFNPAITVIGGKLYVAWQEQSGSNSQVRVATFNGTSWVPVGGALNINPTKDAEIPSIVGVDGVPWVAWDENNGTAHLVHVAAFNGSWTPMGGAIGFSPHLGDFEADITQIGGVPYLAWRDQATGVPQVHVDKWASAGHWAQVGGALNVNPKQDARTPTIVGVNGTPYVAWQEKSGSTYKIRVKRLVNPPNTRISSSSIGAEEGKSDLQVRRRRPGDRLSVQPDEGQHEAVLHKLSLAEDLHRPEARFI